MTKPTGLTLGPTQADPSPRLESPDHSWGDRWAWPVGHLGHLRELSAGGEVRRKRPPGTGRLLQRAVETAPSWRGGVPRPEPCSPQVSDCAQRWQECLAAAIQDGAEPTRVKGAVLAGRAWEEHPSQETGRYGHVGDPHTPMETPASPSHVQVRTPAQPLDKSVYCRQPPPLRPTGQLARTGQASGARRHPPEPGPSREQVRGGAAPHGPPAGTWAVAVGDSHPPRGSTLPVIAFIRLLDSKAAVRREGPPRGWAQLPGRSPTGPRQPPRPARLPAAPRTAVRDGGGARGRTPGGPCLRNPLEPQAGRWMAPPGRLSARRGRK